MQGMKMRVVVYSGNAKVYDAMRQAVWSLVCNTQIDKVYCLIEDDHLDGFPEQCEFINVSDQTYFSPKSPNYHQKWSYMVLLRVAYVYLFPDLDKVLSLDTDTLVVDDIGELWDIDISDYYCAGVIEPEKTERYGQYINTGVAMYNLEKLRDGTADNMIKSLNKTHYDFPDQDVICVFCRGNILPLDPAYNDTFFTGFSARPKIRHWAIVNNCTDRDDWKSVYEYATKNKSKIPERK